jgi:geranylgeranyl diphosphate synthase, type I
MENALQKLSGMMIPAIEQELKQAVLQTRQPGLEEMTAMMSYHMGWEGEGAGAEARGKRIRPLLLLLCASAAGGDWRSALPGAVAVELVHNFSLVHDDIQDQSPLRRGRATLWSLHGTAQALNTGDALFVLAQLAVLRLADTVSQAAALDAALVLQETCLALTQGQYLDLSYEGRTDLGEEEYWPMVRGKTAALLSACTYIGALAGGAQPDICQKYREFGDLLGMAFQVQDDLLGIWGDVAVTGKSTASDLVTGKKTLPVLYGLGKQGAFARRWAQGMIRPDETPALAARLEVEGARDYVSQAAELLTQQALEKLEQVRPTGQDQSSDEAAQAWLAIGAMTRRLLKRTN